MAGFFAGRLLQGLDLLVTAEFWFRKATVLSRGQDTTAAQLFQQCRVKRLYGPLCKAYPVRVDFTEYGKAVFATEDIEAGQVAFQDSAAVHAQLLDSFNVPACENCGASLMRPRDYFGNKMDGFDESLKNLIHTHWPEQCPVSCDNCSREKYCSDDCKKAAWMSYHWVICPSLNSAADKIFDICENSGNFFNDKGAKVEVWKGHFSPMTLVKLWATVVSKAAQLMEEEGLDEPNKEHWVKAKMPFRK